MNTIIKKAGIFFIALSLTACNESEMFEEELYKKVICILSDDNQVFSVEHDLNEEVSTGYISISSGGTMAVDKDVLVELEFDNDLLTKYNRLQYDTATLKFARQLPEWRYEIPVMSATLKKGSEDQYSRVEIKVKPEGLSPDSIYMVPLRIKNVSDYEVNPAKENVLYRVFLKNNYARQEETTYYKMKGRKQNEGDEKVISVTTDKVFYPLTKDKVRTLAGTKAFSDKNPTLEEIDKWGIVVQINSDNTVTLSPSGSLELEMLGTSSDNKYEEEESGSGFTSKIQKFYFSYKYKDSESGKWITMTETCTRQ